MGQMRTEQEIQEKLKFLQEQAANGNDFEGKREIARLKWVLGIGPDLIHVPKPGR
jgi:hypothetical protein